MENTLNWVRQLHAAKMGQDELLRAESWSAFAGVGARPAFDDGNTLKVPGACDGDRSSERRDRSVTPRAPSSELEGQKAAVTDRLPVERHLSKDSSFTTVASAEVSDDEDYSSTAASSGSLDDGNFLYLSPKDLPEPSYWLRPSAYPVELLTSFLSTAIYRLWYPVEAAGLSEASASVSAPRSAASPNASASQRNASLLSADRPKFETYISNILFYMRPTPVAVEKTVELIEKLRGGVATPESQVFGSHYAVTAVALMLSCKVLDGESLLSVVANCGAAANGIHP